MTSEPVMAVGDAMVATIKPGSGTSKKRFLHVVFLNGSERWYELDSHGWKLLTSDRVIRVGKGPGRKHIPLDNVEYYSPV